MDPALKKIADGVSLAAGAFLFAAIFYFSWISNPSMSAIHWLPGWLTRWADLHDQLRTAVPFALLGGIIGILATPPKTVRSLVKIWLFLTGLALVVETGQNFLPKRTFDWIDIFWGSAGSATGLVAGYFVLGAVSRRLTGIYADIPDSPQHISRSSCAVPPTLYFLGLRFWNDDTNLLLREMDKVGGMLAVPSAPSLAQAAEDPLLLKAYQSSDWSVMDGGYVALIVRLFGRSVRRISGLQLIEKMTGPAELSPIPLRDRRVMWVIPSMLEGERIRKYLSKQSFDKDKQNYYLAPFYKSDEEFDDRQLIAAVRELDPDWIILCLGGGRQEKLGYYLREATRHADQRPVILCTGAAIAFFTGGQANIPPWADRLYLGWLLRIMSKPQDFLPRYVKAAWHFPLVLWRQRGTWFDHPED